MVRLFRKASLRSGAIFTLLFALCILVPVGTLGASIADESAPIVTAIEIAPTRYLSNEDMLSTMTETKIGERFDADKLMADLWAIHSLGLERHQEVVFYDFEADLVPHGDGVKVVVYPIEMPIVSGFAVDIDAIDRERFLETFELKPGQVLNVEALYAAIDKSIDALFTSTGYFFNLTDLSMDDADVVHIQLRAVRVASITITGNEKTRDYVLEREIRTQVGEPLNVRQLNEDWRRLMHLRLFDDVDPVATEWPDDRLKADVVFNVQERKTGMAGFGAGYSSVDKFVGYLELADENLFGRGQFGAVRWEFGSNKTSYDLSFYEPNVAGTRASAGFGLYNRTQRLTGENETYKEQHSVGGNITLGKRFTDFLQGSIRLKMETVTNTHEDPALSKTDVTRSIRLGLSGDTTDLPFYPTRGMRYGASTEVAGTFLGGDTEFTKYEANWSTYLNVGRNDQVVAFRLMGGFSPGSLPSQESFRVGGPDSVRAYNYGAMRGDKMVVGNAEYRFKITDTVQGVVFADAGNAWAAGDDVNLKDLRAAVGLGVRFETPLGMMRLDYGVGDSGGRAFFSIGPSF